MYNPGIRIYKHSFQLSRPDANHYEPSEDFPECCFAIEWVGTGNPCTTLHHVVKMLGTADEDDFIALRVNPGELDISTLLLYVS